MGADIWVPRIARISSMRDETPDTRSFLLHFRDPHEANGFRYLPGQFIELSVFGYGEAPFCIASSPTRPDGLKITVRRTGRLTAALFHLMPRDEVGIRGPFGNGFDLEKARGRDLLFVAGGLGLPPLRSLICNVLDQRDRFRKVTICYGARTPADLTYKDELEQWRTAKGVEVYVTVDIAKPGWTGNVGMVPVLFNKTVLTPQNTVAYVCGPPIMIKFVVQDLLTRGFDEESVVSTLERMMQCGIGKCNHCAIGHRYVCRDGPVFDYRQIRELVE